MAWTKEEPKVSGWFWARHKTMGKVVVNVLVVDGIAHTQENGFSGWNRHYGSFVEWQTEPLPMPED